MKKSYLYFKKSFRELLSKQWYNESVFIKGSLGEGLPRFKSLARVARSPDGINGHVSGTQASFQFGGRRPRIG